MSKHTATPWSYEWDRNEPAYDDELEIYGAGNELVASLNIIPPERLASGMVACGCGGDPEANAAFIIRAANCHDDMLAALKAARDDLRDVPGRKAPPSMAIVEAAITKAESE